MNASTSLKDRVRALTPLQRALLARRLQREDASPPPARSASQLVAYAVAGSGAVLDAEELRDALRARVPEYMVPSHVVVLDALPRTPNGKVDRRALPAPAPSTPGEQGGGPQARTPVEQQLLDIWADVLRMERIHVEDNFFEIGGDSIASIQIISRANRAGIQIKPSQFFDYPTIAALARVATTEQQEAALEVASAGPVPMTPIQRWFFEQDLPDPSHWNQVLALDVDPAADLHQLEAALRAGVAAHDAFRLRYVKEADGWTQKLVAPEDAVIDVVRHTRHPGDTGADIQAASQDALDLAAGPLVRADLVVRGEDSPARLMLTVHHLVIDVLSWPVLLDSIETAYQQLRDGQAPELSGSGTPFSRWAEALVALTDSDELATERNVWLEQAKRPVASLPTDRAGINTEQTAQTLSHALDVDETRALTEATATYGMKVPEMVLTALAVALADWTGSPHVRIDLEGHGREDLDGLPDASSSVGWFTSLYPVTLHPASLGGPREALIHVKESLRGVPRKGIGYGMLRYLTSEDTHRQLEASPAEVLFNYMGQASPSFSPDSPFQSPVELTGSRGADGTRAYLIEINALIEDGSLTIRWTYSTEQHQSETIENLARETHAALQTLVAHCRAPEAGAYTPSDFPDVDLGQDDLDALLGDFD